MKKVVLLMLITLQLVLPALADQAYGRFGRFHEDGLLTTNVFPRGFTLLGTNPELNIRWGDPKAPLSAVVTSINPTEKILAVEGGGVGAPSSIRYTLVYPGFAATFGRQLVLRFSNRAGKSVRVGLDPTRLKQGWLLVIPADRYPAVPLLIKVPRTQGTKAWFTGDGLTIESPVPLGEVIFTTPTGMRPVGSLDAAWKAVSDWGDAPIPVLQAVSNTLTSDETLTTQTWNTPFAPISPILSLALQSGFPVKISGPLVRTEIRTRYGPYTYVAAKSSRISMELPRVPATALYGEGLATPSGRLVASPPQTSPAASVWNLYPWLQSVERLTPFLRANVIRTYRVRRAKVTLADTSEPITGVHLQLPRSRNETSKRELDDVVALARLVLCDYAYGMHVDDEVGLSHLKSSLQALVNAVQVRTDWLWGCVGRADDGYQSLDPVEIGDVASALAIALQNPGASLTPGEREDASVALMSHCWSAFSRETLMTFAFTASMLPPGRPVLYLDEINTFALSPTSPSDSVDTATSIRVSDATSDLLLESKITAGAGSRMGRLRSGGDLGIVDADGLRIVGVMDTAINNIEMKVISDSGRIRILKLVTSERWSNATVRINGKSVHAIQVSDELQCVIPPFSGTATLQLAAHNEALNGYVFLDPLFGIISRQNDVSVFGPGSSR